jgi:hypothetical protein
MGQAFRPVCRISVAAIVLMVFVSSAPCAEMDEPDAPWDLWLYLNFDEKQAEAPHFLDLSGHGNHAFADYRNLASLTSNHGGKVGEAFEKYWAEVPGDDLNLTECIVVDCWVKPSVTLEYRYRHSWYTILSKGISGATDVYSLRYKAHTGELQFAIRDRGVPHVAAVRRTLRKDSWIHLRGSYDGKTVRLFENGKEIAATEHTGRIDVTREPLKVHTGWAADYRFPGLLDELRIYGKKGENSEPAKNPQDRMRLYPHEAERSVSIEHPAFPGRLFGYAVPESLGRDEGKVYGHWDWSPVNWQGPNDQGMIWFRGENDKVIFFVQMTPCEDYIDVVQTVTNKTDATWNHVYSFHCLTTINHPEFRDVEMVRTCLPIENKGLTPSRDILGKDDSHGVVHMVTPSFGEHEFADQFPLATLKANAPYSLIESRNEKWVAAVITENAAFLFTNGGNSCIHTCPGFGQLKPNEKKTSRSRIYVFQGTKNDFLLELTRIPWYNNRNR